MFNLFRRRKIDLEKTAELYNDIGVAAVERIGSVDTKFLLYVEINEDSVSSFFCHATNESQVVDSLPSDDRVSLAIWALRSYLESVGAQHVWKSMEYVADYGEIDTVLLYDTPFAGAELALWEKTPALLEKHFPGKPHRPQS